MKINFVCLGNICRSPLAHHVMEDIVRKNGMEKRFTIDSSGLGGWHIGDLPDYRMRDVAFKAGYKLTHRARQFKKEDFYEFDLILAMDQEILQGCKRLLPSLDVQNRLKLFREFDPIQDSLDCPDPYYGTRKDFENVLQIVERCCTSLFEKLTQN